jgi:hypothetical protein
MLVVCSCASADTLRLKSGRTIEGTYLGGDARNVRFDAGDRVQTFSINDVSEIRFGSAETATNGALNPEPMQSAAPSRSTSSTSVSTSEIPAGTPLVLRMIDDVDSARDTVGQTFRASVDEAIIVGERTVVPRGADVVVKLVEDKQSGRISGKTEMTLDVVSVVVNGRMTDVRTEEVTRESASRTGKSGQVVGGTAALGAIIGAIAGGGKGAAIGAVSGAAAGGAVQVMTKGERVRIPSETRLTFTLQQPLRI